MADVGTKLIFENEQVRVWEFTLQPGESTGSHHHELDYFFYPHIGWANGIPKSHALKLANGKETFSDSFEFPKETVIFSVSAGITVQYGKFEKRISDQQIIQKGNWATPFAHDSVR